MGERFPPFDYASKCAEFRLDVPDDLNVAFDVAPRRGSTQPAAFATRACVNERVEERLNAGIIRMSPADWKCGPKPMVVDLITPFGGREKALEELAEVMGAARSDLV